AKIQKAKGLKKGAILKKEFVATLPLSKCLEISFEDEKLEEKVQNAREYYDEAKIDIDAKFEAKKKSITQSNELSQG
ncbi:hypothetical protein NAI67_13925, partial [Francisella tularensis subsp. holarctica]|uniref:hypothetical protein n=1 Tax=Francisella tularensis TaxID=263 RepID=UPI002381C689